MTILHNIFNSLTPFGGRWRGALLLLLFPLLANAQSSQLTALWKEYDQAMDKDLPQTGLKVLEKISKKAESEKAYANLLKAELKKAEITDYLAPDSMEIVTSTLKKKTEQMKSKDKVTYAILNLALYKNSASEESYLEEAFADMDILARTKSEDWSIILNQKNEIDAFNSDMLSIMGYAANQQKRLFDYYKKAGNRRACAWLAQETNVCSDAKELALLVEEYKDLQEGALLAKRYYEMCQQDNAMTAAEKYQLLQTYRKQWAGTKEADIFEDFEKNWQAGELRIKSLPNILPIDKEKKLELTSKNVSKAKLSIIPLSVAGRNVPTNSESNINRYYEKLLAQYATKSGNGYKGQIDITKEFQIENCYTSALDSVIIPGLKSGVYVLKLESLDEKDNASYKDPNGFIISKNSSRVADQVLLYVSNMKILRLPLPNKKERQVVVDSETGHEIKDAKVFQDKRKGFVAYNNADNGMPYTQIYTSNFYSYSPEKEDFHLNAYIDRGIYRPGQTVQIAAIMHKTTDGVNTSVVPNQKITFRLLDANYQTVTEKLVTTDEFGAASAEFVLPTDRLTGHWQIETSADKSNAYTNFRVEEYKRPTFEVSFDKYEKEYQLGDTIKVTGVAKTYAGVPVANSKVAYSVKREMPWWCWWRGYGLGERLMTDTIVTNDKGEFEAIVPLSVPRQKSEVSPFKGYSEGLLSCYNYKIEAAVTSISGETREGETFITASNKPLMFKVSVKDKFINTDASGLSVSVRNSAGVEIKDAKLAFKLNNHAKAYATAEEVNAAIKQLPSGKHTLYATATYKDNVERDTVSFTIFSLDDKKPVEETKHWTYITHRQFKADDDVITLQLGSSDEDVEIFYDVFVGEEHKESTVLHASNSLIRKDFNAIKGKNILVTYAWVKEGRLYTNSDLLEQAVPEKSLSLTWKTFRNKLLPGQQEEWTLNIQNPRTKTPGNYQLLACLYDKSLDAIASTNWNSWLGMRTGGSSTQWSISNNRVGSLNLYRYFKPSTYNSPVMSSFNVWPFTGQFYGNRDKVYDMLMYSRAPGAMANGIKAKANFAAPIVKQDSEEMAVADGALQEVAILEEPKPQPEEVPTATTSDAMAGLRTNFSETAFFYPQLFADKNGDVSIKFTLPESTTTWQFRALAHDKDMNNGMLQDEIIAQKQLMISPNMPRFIRKGDKAVLASTISNLSEKTLNAKTTIEILDPETEKVLYTESTANTLEAGKTAAVNFNLKTPSNSPTGGGQNLAEGVYIVKIFTESLTHVDSSLPPVGETEGVSVEYSDGEQHYLAVIDNVEPVLNTIAITMLKPGTEVIATPTLFPADATEKKLTVEWTENPAWLMLETLPYMNSQDQTTIYSKAAAYYANALGANILHAMQEKTKQTILRQNESGSSSSAPVREASASGSPLEKSPELKTLLLNETPWVMDAKNETERIQMLRNFYDENKLAYNQEQLISKLKSEQKSDGGWSWCPDMETSYWMTSEICELFVRLNNMIGKQNATSDMLKKAMNCLQKKAHDEIQEWKKQEKKGNKPYIYDCYALQYVYLKALSGDRLSAQEKSDADFLVKYLKKQECKNSLFMKAKLAIVLHYMGETKMAKEYVQSINEYSAYKEKEGRYFDTRRAEYSWRDYKQPTQTMVIEALRLITPSDLQTIAEYQRWLLMQKRTQMWDTPINTVNNVYAFVTTAPIDDKGYSKNTYIGANIPTVVELEKQEQTAISKQPSASLIEQTPSWGAVYAQFKQKAANISDYSEGLKITREIIPAGSSLPLVGETEGVSVGSKVKVRITVVADRDYDFVQIVDKRAACLEPVVQTSGYRWGYYETPIDSRTCYYFDMLRKGTHTFETEYYIDRAGDYQSGTCTVQCAYAPEYYGRTKAMTIHAK